MIQPQEYEFWVNKPCPKCGEIIFTNEEYNLYKLLMATTAIANNVTSDQSTSLPAKTGKVYNPTTKNSQ